MIIGQLKNKVKLSDFIIYQNIEYNISGDEKIIHCPFHDDNTPSLYLNDNLGVYNCFGCEANGDLFNLIDGYYQQLSYKEKIKLVEKNILPNIGKSKIEKNIKSSKFENKKSMVIIKDKTYYDILLYICKYYQDELSDEIISKYLLSKDDINYYFLGKNRQNKGYGFNKKVIKKFKIGYSPNNKTLFNNLTDIYGEEILNNYIIDNNFLGIFDKKGMPLFKNRIVFPILLNGRVESFQSKQTEYTPKNKYQIAKYIFTKTDKDYVYNTDTLNESNFIFVTEGISDCISLEQRGFPAIAMMGVDVKKNILKKISIQLKGKEVFILFDNEKNKAGNKGAKRLQDNLKKLNVISSIVEIPLKEGESKIDINSYFLNHSKNDFNKILGSHIIK